LRHEISEKQYQAQIAELTKILYAAFRQLETPEVRPPVQSDCELRQADSTKDPFPKTETAVGALAPAA
jgi:hypothetical protein